MEFDRGGTTGIATMATATVRISLANNVPGHSIFCTTNVYAYLNICSILSAITLSDYIQIICYHNLHHHF